MEVIAPNLIKTAKRLLMEYCKNKVSREFTLAALKDYLEKDGNTEHFRFLLHLTLFLHWNHDEVRKLHKFGEVYPLVPNEKIKGLSSTDYINFVKEIGLQRNFMVMIGALGRLDFVKQLFELAWHEYIMVNFESHACGFVDLTRYHNNYEKSYIIYFKFGIKNACMRALVLRQKPSMLSNLLKMIAIGCMNPEDYIDDSEVSEINMNWELMPSRKALLEEMKIYISEYELDSRFENSPFVFEIMEYVSQGFSQLEIGEDEINSWENESVTVHNINVNWKHYIGICAHLSYLVVRKHEFEFDSDEKKNVFNDILRHLERFRILKPKDELEIFLSHEYSFKTCCAFLRELSVSYRFQASWLLQFLKYSEALNTPEGLDTIENVLIKRADDKVAIEFVTQVSRFLKLNSEEKQQSEEAERKVVRLKQAALFLFNRVGILAKNAIILEVFKDGLHTLFKNSVLEIGLGSLRPLVRGLSKKNAEAIKDFQKKIYYDAIQDPLPTITAIVHSSFRTQIFSGLDSLKIFLTLQIGEKYADNNFPSCSTVIEVAIYKLFLEFGEGDPMWNFGLDAIPQTVSNGHITFTKMVIILKKLFKEYTIMNYPDNLSKIVKCFRSLIGTYLICNEIPLEELKQIKLFLVRCKSLTHVCEVSVNLMQLRESCIEFLHFLDPKSEKKEELELLLEEMNDKELSVLEFAAVYIRYPDLKNQIKERIMKESIVDPKFNTLDGYKELRSVIMTMIVSSCRTEWTHLIDFIDEFISHFPIMSKSNTLKFVFEMVSMAFQSKSHQPLWKILDFYQEYLKSKYEDLSREPHHLHVNHVKELVGLLIGLYKVDDLTLEQPKLTPHAQNQKSSIAEGIINIIRDLFEYFRVKKVVYEESVKKEMMILVTMIPRLMPNSTGFCNNDLPYETILDSLESMSICENSDSE